MKIVNGRPGPRLRSWHRRGLGGGVLISTAAGAFEMYPSNASGSWQFHARVLERLIHGTLINLPKRLSTPQEANSLPVG